MLVGTILVTIEAQFAKIGDGLGLDALEMMSSRPKYGQILTFSPRIINFMVYFTLR
jgi:hypothetical protein